MATCGVKRVAGGNVKIPKLCAHHPIRLRLSKLTRREFNILESLFQQDSNPSLFIRRNLANQLGMHQRTIQIWFQNRRAKAIRMNELSPAKPSPPSDSMFSRRNHPIYRRAKYPALKISEFWATTMSCIKYYNY
ncbi:hypothetical protein L0F63_000056 [Massospora cicadina]|nr:hypothetical protein L0F63_000056 [Massospora cicadina]